MKEAEIEMILQRAQGKVPRGEPRIISDNGPQFIARDFKEFIRISSMTVLSAVERKIGKMAQNLETECIRALMPLTVEDARCLIQS